jgi:hypothetical protein
VSLTPLISELAGLGIGWKALTAIGLKKEDVCFANLHFHISFSMRFGYAMG